MQKVRHDVQLSVELGLVAERLRCRQCRSPHGPWLREVCRVLEVFDVGDFDFRRFKCLSWKLTPIISALKNLN